MEAYQRISISAGRTSEEQDIRLEIVIWYPGILIPCLLISGYPDALYSWMEAYQRISISAGRTSEDQNIRRLIFIWYPDTLMRFTPRWKHIRIPEYQ